MIPILITIVVILLIATLVLLGVLIMNNSASRRDITAQSTSIDMLKSQIETIKGSQDKSTESPINTAAFTVFQEKLEEVLKTLTEREERVLRLRFGLGDGYPRTLEEVGSVFKVTRERVRQIEAKAIRKMRHPTRSRKLKTFLDWVVSE